MNHVPWTIRVITLINSGMMGTWKTERLGESKRSGRMICSFDMIMFLAWIKLCNFARTGLGLRNSGNSSRQCPLHNCEFIFICYMYYRVCVKMCILTLIFWQIGSQTDANLNLNFSFTVPARLSIRKFGNACIHCELIDDEWMAHERGWFYDMSIVEYVKLRIN